jgi:RNA exonuclease NGL2
MIAFKKNLYSLVSVKVVFYDDEYAGKEGGPSRIGSSFKTRNIANLVALRNRDNEAEGIIVATTHLFWHPRSGQQPESNRIFTQL